jgi:hypothetical protein
MYTVISPIIVVCLIMVGCTAPNYLSVAPADPVGQDRRLDPSRPEQAIVRDQHLGGLQVELRSLEESLFRAEQKRLSACQQPEAAQVSSLAYHRCQFADQLYERLKEEVARSKEQYLHAMSGSGGSSR